MNDLNGVNEYGVPLHACNGYRQDEHYWKWLEYRRLNPGVAWRAWVTREQMQEIFG